MIILFLSLVIYAAAVNQTYYLDVRWDDMTKKDDGTWEYTGNGKLPYNHGLRILPAIYMARAKLMEGDHMELIPSPSNWQFSQNAQRNQSDPQSFPGLKDLGKCEYNSQRCQIGVDYAQYRQQKFIEENSTMEFVFPSASLKYDDNYFSNMLKETTVLNNTEGFMGILGSTDGAAVAAKVAKSLGFPHIVSHVTDSLGKGFKIFLFRMIKFKVVCINHQRF